MCGFYLLLSEAGGQCGLEELSGQQDLGKVGQRMMKWSKFNEHIETTV